MKQTCLSIRRHNKSSFNSITCLGRRALSGFSFAGVKKLDDIMKVDLIKEKTKAEVSDIWLTYHEEKERVYGDIMSGKDGMKLMDRAEKK